jgi:predicted nucleic acid-binding protein
MSEVVSTDATVLIYLARLDDLDYLDNLFEEIRVSETVYKEVVTRGREEQYADALPIEAATDQFIDVVTLSDETVSRADEIQEASGLERGECTAIALVEEEGARCLTDDHAARKTAESLGISVNGTFFVLLEALDQGRISLEKYVEKLDDLTDSGFRISASLYRRAIEKGENLTE